MIDYREVRSVLCVPGHDEAKIKKCRSFGADLILFDMEDSVPANRKGLARDLVAEHAGPHDAVRVNSTVRDPFKFDRDADLRAAQNAGSIWIPKVRKRDGYWWDTADWWGRQVVLILESPEVIFDGWLEGLLPGTNASALAFGAMDFTACVGTAGATLLDSARQRVAQLGAAYGLPTIDSPCTSLDWYAASREATRAARMGYTGKGCLNEGHVEPVNAKFSGSDLPIAERVVPLADESKDSVVVFDGQVYGPAMIEYFRGVLNAGS